MMDKWINRMIIKKVIANGQKAKKELAKNCASAGQVSQNLLLTILRDNAETEYGKEHGFASIKSAAEYRRKVPFSTYDDYAPYIERMVDSGEKDLITTYPIRHYAVSSGTVGVPKHIPVSQRTLDLYSAYGCNIDFAVMDEWYRQKTGRSFPAGKGLYALEAREMYMDNGLPKGPISATTIKPVKKFIPYIFSSPWEVISPKGNMDMKYLKIRYALAEPELTFMAGAFMTAIVDLMDYMKGHWPMLVADIREGKINPDVVMPPETRELLEGRMKPDPVRADALQAVFEEGFDTPIVPRLWKHMSWIAAIGTGDFKSYTDKMRDYAGPDIPMDFTVYGASESLMAVANKAEDDAFVLIPDSGFYEFIPMTGDDDSKTLLLDELLPGRDYEIVLTNLSGFYRYRIGDVIRVVGYEGQSPRLRFVYRKNQMVNIAGEKTNAESLAWSVSEFARETGCIVADYSVYADTDAVPGRYVVLVEPDRPLAMERMAEYTRIVEEKLGFANPSFGDKVAKGVLGPTQLYFEQLETYALYRDLMVMKGISPNQLKPVRVIDTPMKEKFFFGLIEKEES